LAVEKPDLNDLVREVTYAPKRNPLSDVDKILRTFSLSNAKDHLCKFW